LQLQFQYRDVACGMKFRREFGRGRSDFRHGLAQACHLLRAHGVEPFSAHVAQQIQHCVADQFLAARIFAERKALARRQQQQLGETRAESGIDARLFAIAMRIECRYRKCRIADAAGFEYIGLGDAEPPKFHLQARVAQQRNIDRAIRIQWLRQQCIQRVVGIVRGRCVPGQRGAVAVFDQRMNLIHALRARQAHAARE